MLKNSTPGITLKKEVWTMHDDALLDNQLLPNKPANAQSCRLIHHLFGTVGLMIL
jgi:hypothetical protein